MKKYTLKRFTALGLAVYAAATFTGCANNNDNSTTDDKRESIELNTSLFTVMFADEDGQVYDDSLVIGGEYVPSITIPDKENYEFLGWYLNNQEYDFRTPVDENITLIAKWRAKKFENKEDFLTAINNMVQDNNKICIYHSLEDDSLYINISSVDAFSLIKDIISMNRDLLNGIRVEFTNITRDDLDKIASLPSNMIYTFGFAGDFRDVSLKDLLSNYNISGMALYSGNLSGDDLGWILSTNYVDFHIYSEDFDAYDILDKFSNESKCGYLTVYLNGNAANKRVVLPNIGVVRIYNSMQAKGTKVICQSNTIYIGAQYAKELNLRIPDDSHVVIYGDYSYEETFGVKDVLNVPLLYNLRNASEVEVDLNDVKLVGQKDNEGMKYTELSNTFLGYIDETGFGR